MLTSMSHLFTSISSRRLCLFAALAFLLTVPACVPYVKYEDAVAKLNRANQVNQDLERSMRAAQLGESTTGGDLRAAVLKIESLEMQNAALKRQAETLQMQVDELNASRNELPQAIFPEGFGNLEINQDTGGIMLRNDVLFSPGKSTLRNEAKAVLDQLQGLIQREHADKFIFIDGHSDNTPITKSAKVNKDNWDLAAKRAHAVFEYFKGKGLPETQMVITSHGYAQPVSGVDINSKAGRSKCRRVEIRIKEASY